MDGMNTTERANIFDFAKIVNEAHERMKEIPRYHVGELFLTIARRVGGKPLHSSDHGPLDLQLESYSCVSLPRASATFTDPYDGKEYRIIIEPVIAGKNDKAESL